MKSEDVESEMLKAEARGEAKRTIGADGVIRWRLTEKGRAAAEAMIDRLRGAE